MPEPGVLAGADDVLDAGVDAVRGVDVGALAAPASRGRGQVRRPEAVAPAVGGLEQGQLQVIGRSFARWSPGMPRKHADFVIRMGAEGDVEACARLAEAVGAGEAGAWRQTLTRTVRDGRQRALFVAEAGGQVVGYGRVVCAQADPAVPTAAAAGWYLLGRGSPSTRPGGGGESARH